MARAKLDHYELVAVALLIVIVVASVLTGCTAVEVYRDENGPNGPTSFKVPAFAPRTPCVTPDAEK